MDVVDAMSSRRARNQQVLIVVSQVAALSCWFSASAVSSSLQSALEIGDLGIVLLASSVQLGFVFGATTSALLNLPDRLPPHLLYGVSALIASGCTALVALAARDMATAVVLRFMTGVALAGVYPVGMKLMASWAPAWQRGRALGLLVGGLTLGSAVPQLIRGFENLPWQGVLLTASLITAVGGVIVLAGVRSGPSFDAPAVRFDPRVALRMFQDPRPRLANLGYLGHMWELYALWTWLPVFVFHSQQAQGGSTGSAVNILSFFSIGVAGVLGCLAGGWAADRFGRPAAAATALAVSGTCCVLSPLAFGQPLPWLAVLLLVWGASVIADSGVFSTALSESVDRGYVGTALTVQTAAGFLLTIVSIHLIPILAGWVGWQFALVVLGLGPAVGVRAMVRFGRLPQASVRTEATPRQPQQEKQ